MAIYYSQIKNLKRSTGSNSLSSLSYIIGEKVKDETTGRTFNYGRNERVFAYGMELPNGSTFKSPSELFNSLESFEKQNNARMAKKIICALPREFDEETQKRVVRDFVKKNFTDKGYPSVWAIHYDDDNNNPHVHIMVANRQLNEKGEWAKYKNKKETVLDNKGRRMPQIDKDKVAQWESETGRTFNQEDFEYEELCSKFQKLGKRNSKLWQRKNVISNYLDQKATLNDIREDWANQCNVYLEEENKISHKSLIDQGISDKLPQIKLGYEVTNLAKKGIYTERWQENEKIKLTNNFMAEKKRELSHVLKQIKENIDERIRTFETRIRGIKERYEPRIRGLEQRINGVNERYESRITGLVQRIKEIEERSISVESIETPAFDQETIYEMVQDISKRYWNSVTDGSSAISELCDEDEEFNQYINSLSGEEFDELVAKSDEIVEQERDEIY